MTATDVLAPHGTRYRYADGCDCDPCREAEMVVRRRRARNRNMGISVYVDAAPVRAHVRSLMDAGMGYPQLAKRSGVDQSSLIYLMCGRSVRGRRPARKMSRANAEALLAINAPDLAAGARRVDVGAMRRGQAMVAGGWPVAVLAREAGVDRSIMRRILYGVPVWRANADVIYPLFARLWDQTPPQDTPRQRAAVTQARKLAARNGWVVAMAWDGPAIDDPAATPDTGRKDRWGIAADPVEVAELVAGRKPADWATKASRVEAYRRLFASGLSVTEVAARLQVCERSAGRARARLGMGQAQTDEENAA